MKTQEKINQSIYTVFGIGKIADIVSDLVDRIDEDEWQDIKDGNEFDIICDIIDNGLIYNDDIWEIMKHYQNPQNADYMGAISELQEDLYTLLHKIVNK